MIAGYYIALLSRKKKKPGYVRVKDIVRRARSASFNKKRDE
jgi:hypothetical protein